MVSTLLLFCNSLCIIFLSYGFIGSSLTSLPVLITVFATFSAKSFNVFYNKVPTSAGQYTMEHSAYVFVLDKDANSVLLFREGMALEEMLSDLRELQQFN